MKPDPVPFFEVCLLSHANWQETERALKSAWRFGLHTHLGVTVEAECPFSHPLLSVYACPWKDDFSFVRNSLLDQIASDTPYFLWIDSDEEILCSPSVPPPNMMRNVYSAAIAMQSGLTGNKRSSLHRNSPDLRWAGLIHERIEHIAGEPVGVADPCPGLAVVHHGYEDRDYEVKKLTRNALIAQEAIAAGSRHPGDTASIAREKAALGGASAHDWLAAYRETEAYSLANDLPKDLCYEAAAGLAYCGYLRPALQMASANPLNIPLQIALLAAQFAATGQHDAERFELVLEILQRILWDVRFAFDAELVKASREQLEQFIERQAQDLEWDRTSQAAKGNAPAMNAQQLYRQCPDVLLETFEDDTLLLSPETNRVVSLNVSGKVFWDALEQGASVNECCALLEEATGETLEAEAAAQIGSFFQTLLDSGMIKEA